jgi:hypothetical protein
MSSYYEALPIYKAAMDIAVRVDAVVQRFAKGHKYTLGGRLRDTTLDVVVLVARCNRRAERARELPVLCDRIEELKLMVNLGKEVKAFASFKQFAEVMDQLVTLARQAEAWRRATVANINVRPEPGRPPSSPREL